MRGGFRGGRGGMDRGYGGGVKLYYIVGERGIRIWCGSMVDLLHLGLQVIYR